MKIQDFNFSKITRRDTDLMDFVERVRKIINFGRYQMRIVTAVPTWTGEEGEHLIYILGAIKRFYFWDGTNSTWQYIEWSGAGGVSAIADADVDTQIQTEESSDEDKIRFDTAGIERGLIKNTGTWSITHRTIDDGNACEIVRSIPAWVSGVAYTTVDTGGLGSDIVQNSSLNEYTCISSHTSASTTQPGVGATWTTVWKTNGITLSTYVNEYAPNSAYSNQASLVVGVGNTNYTQHIFRSYIKYPAGTNYVYLYIHTVGWNRNGRGRSIEVRNVTAADWTTSLTWNTQPSLGAVLQYIYDPTIYAGYAHTHTSIYYYPYIYVPIYVSGSDSCCIKWIDESDFPYEPDPPLDASWCWIQFGSIIYASSYGRPRIT